jgi:hypothetical protein
MMKKETPILYLLATKLSGHGDSQNNRFPVFIHNMMLRLVRGVYYECKQD